MTGRGPGEVVESRGQTDSSRRAYLECHSDDRAAIFPIAFSECHSAGRVRPNDPYDPATAHHLGQCAFIGETDEAMLRLLLKVTDTGDYDWVQCGSCDAGWQVAHYAAESVG